MKSESSIFEKAVKQVHVFRGNFYLLSPLNMNCAKKRGDMTLCYICGNPIL